MDETRTRTSAVDPLRVARAVQQSGRPSGANGEPCGGAAGAPVPAEALRGPMLVVSRDRFVVRRNQWYVSQAVILVEHQEHLRRELERGTLDQDLVDSLVRLEQTEPLRQADCQADRFVGLLRHVLTSASDGVVAVRVTEPRWAAALREYQDLFPGLHVMPGHDPLVVALSAACMRRHISERRRVAALLDANREWASFAGKSGRGHVAAPRGALSIGGPDSSVQIASDGARNPHRGSSWGYFTSEGSFRMGTCAGTVVASELRGLWMALSDHLDVPVVVWTDSRRAIALVNTLMRTGVEPLDHEAGRAAREVAELLTLRRQREMPTSLRWVRAHTDRFEDAPAILNDAADRLAKLALRRWCTPGLAQGVEDIALSIAREASTRLAQTEDACCAPEETQVQSPAHVQARASEPEPDEPVEQYYQSFA